MTASSRNDRLREAAERLLNEVAVNGKKGDPFSADIELVAVHALAAQPAQQPAGWKLVPIEPTDDMLFAAEKSEPRGYRELYSAMVDAAQPAPVQASEPVAWRYQDARGNFRYRGYVEGFDREYAILKPEPLYAAPKPAAAVLSKETPWEYHKRIQSGIDRVLDSGGRPIFGAIQEI